jgi:hypothetical protein
MASDTPGAGSASRCRCLAPILLLIVILQCAVPVSAQPTWIIVPGVGIGPVTLGMAVTDVIAALGPPPAWCSLNPSGEEKDTTGVFYYPARGLALTLSSSAYGSRAIVVAIHIVAGYSAKLTDETSVGTNGKGYRKCWPNGDVTLQFASNSYTMSDGIRPGSVETEVVAKLGEPQALYQAVGSRTDTSADGAGTVRAHRTLLIPYVARIYSYDGVTLGIANSVVVAIAVSPMPRPSNVPARSHPLREGNQPASVGAGGRPSKAMRAGPPPTRTSGSGLGGHRAIHPATHLAPGM